MTTNQSQRIRRVVGINGGPRKNWNTAKLLKKALEGAAESGAPTELIDLYELNYKGCVSCFQCKTNENYLRGRCGYRDELSPVLELIENSSALIMGSPIYIGDVTGALRSFLERWAFINLAYDSESPSVMEKGPAVGLIYTMNVPSTAMETMGYSSMFRFHKALLERLGCREVQQLYSCDTLQFSDYSRYHAPMFDEAHKKQVRAERFPEELQKAFDMGVLLAAAG
jgi:multimeric flavodoxin WrbA